MNPSTIERIAKVVAAFQKAKAWIDEKTAAMKKAIQDVVDEIARIYDKYIGMPLRWIRDKIAWLTNKLNVLKQKLVDWVKKQMDAVTAWMNKQKKALEDEVKKQLKAKAEAMA